MLQARPRFLLVAYALVLSVEAAANIWINFIGKGRTWDLYPPAQAFWVACSVVVVIVLARRPSMKRLAWVVIVLMFLDSFVDLCAMGHECWWAGPPVLVEWKWDGFANCNGLAADGCEVNLNTDPLHCGSCPNLCNLTNANEGCSAGACAIASCSGENFDVNGNVADGCEVPDNIIVGHTQATANSRGTKPCNDGTSADTFSGKIVSDARVHDPAVTGFNAATGAAPDWWRVFASGGACTNDYSITFTTTGGGATQCYTITFITNNLTVTRTISGNGTVTFSGGSGSYSDDTSIYFKIEKTCNLPTQEAVMYTVSYHL